MNYEYLKEQLGRYIVAPTTKIRQDVAYRMLSHMAGAVYVFGSQEADVAAIAQFDQGQGFSVEQLINIRGTANQVLAEAGYAR